VPTLGPARILTWHYSTATLNSKACFTRPKLRPQRPSNLDRDIVSIASNANIGGSTSAPVCAASLGRPDLQLPGLLAGTIGNAIGTYVGIAVAEFLKWPLISNQAE
jgi:hypothetical protein